MKKASNFIRTDVLAGIGFYPDSRTQLRLQGSYSAYDFVSYDVNQIVDKTWNHNFMLFLSSDYYISPQLQLTASVGGGYEFSDFNSRKNKDINYSIGLRYAIF